MLHSWARLLASLCLSGAIVWAPELTGISGWATWWGRAGVVCNSRVVLLAWFLDWKGLQNGLRGYPGSLACLPGQVALEGMLSSWAGLSCSGDCLVSLARLPLGWGWRLCSAVELSRPCCLAFLSRWGSRMSSSTKTALWLVTQTRQDYKPNSLASWGHWFSSAHQSH